MISKISKQNPQAIIQLHNIKNQLELPQIKLKQDVSTKWNSNFRILVNKIKGQ